MSIVHWIEEKWVCRFGLFSFFPSFSFPSLLSAFVDFSSSRSFSSTKRRRSRRLLSMMEIGVPSISFCLRPRKTMRPKTRGGCRLSVSEGERWLFQANRKVKPFSLPDETPPPPRFCIKVKPLSLIFWIGYNLCVCSVELDKPLFQLDKTFLFSLFWSFPVFVSLDWKNKRHAKVKGGWRNYRVMVSRAPLHCLVIVSQTHTNC